MSTSAPSRSQSLLSCRFRNQGVARYASMLDRCRDGGPAAAERAVFRAVAEGQGGDLQVRRRRPAPRGRRARRLPEEVHVEQERSARSGIGRGAGNAEELRPAQAIVSTTPPSARTPTPPPPPRHAPTPP